MSLIGNFLKVHDAKTLDVIPYSSTSQYAVDHYWAYEKESKKTKNKSWRVRGGG